MNMPANGLSVLMTLSIALLFAAIYLFGGRLAYRPGQKGPPPVPLFRCRHRGGLRFRARAARPGKNAGAHDRIHGRFPKGIPGVQRLSLGHGRFPRLLRARNLGGEFATRPGEPVRARRRCGPMAAVGAYRRLCPVCLAAHVPDGVEAGTTRLPCACMGSPWACTSFRSPAT